MLKTFFLQLTLAAAFTPKNMSPILNSRHSTMTRTSTTTVFSSTNENKNNLDDSFGYFDEEFNRITGDKDFSFIFDVDEDMKPEDVHIILFNPETDREGVHTIEFPKGSGNNMILAFESRSECEQFSQFLKDQQFFDPTPQETKLEALIEYCEQIHVEVQVVPEGMNLKPPKERAVVLDCNPNIEQDMKMLDYLFEISASNEDAEHNSDEQSDDDEGAWE